MLTNDIFQRANQRASELSGLLKNESDRGIALMTAALAEELVKDVLESFLADVKESQDLLHGFNAPIGSFDAKVKLAYALGLIDAELVKALSIIRRVRNIFAHNWKDTSFETRGIIDILSNMPNDRILDLSFGDKSTQRSRFIGSVNGVLFELSLLPLYLIDQKREPAQLVRFSGPSSTEFIDAGQNVVDIAQTFHFIPPHSIK